MEREEIRRLLEQARSNAGWQNLIEVQAALDTGIVGTLHDEHDIKRSARVNAVFMEFVESGLPVDDDWIEALYHPQVFLDADGAYVHMPVKRLA
jgi:hypothetical protein